MVCIWMRFYNHIYPSITERVKIFPSSVSTFEFGPASRQSTVGWRINKYRITLPNIQKINPENIARSFLINCYPNNYVCEQQNTQNNLSPVLSYKIRKHSIIGLMKTFTEQKFNIPTLKGISAKTIEEHLKLYAGYVKNANEILATGQYDRRFPFEFNGMRNHELYFSHFENGY